jgi:NADPH:quinone reductase-like Zn-dependent oxidoreductase
VLSEYVRLRADSIAAVPDSLTDEEAATVPCSAVTAFGCLFGHEHPDEPGKSGPRHSWKTVLTLGTGGVSLFALQLAVAAGASVIATSSSDRRCSEMRSMGAAHTVNYASCLDWPTAVREATGGVGVDLVVEVIGDLQSSLQALGTGGVIGLVGQSLGGADSVRAIDVRAMVRQVATISATMVGSVRTLRHTLEFLVRHGIHPVIGKTHQFERARQAYEDLATGAVFGKVVLSLGTSV